MHRLCVNIFPFYTRDLSIWKLLVLWGKSGRSLGGGHCDNPLQYSCLENSVDRGAWQAIVHGVTKSWTQLKQLSTHTWDCEVVLEPISHGYQGVTVWNQWIKNCMAPRDDFFIRLWSLMKHSSPLKGFVCQFYHVFVFSSQVTLFLWNAILYLETHSFTLLFSGFYKNIITCIIKMFPFLFNHHFFPDDL